MDTAAVLLVLVAGCLSSVRAGGDTPVYRKLVHPIAEQCSRSVGANKVDVQLVTTHSELTSPSQKCLQYCVYHKLKLQDGPIFSPVSDVVGAYKMVFAGQEDKLRYAERNVAACVDFVNSLKYLRDPCIVAGVAQECFRLQQYLV